MINAFFEFIFLPLQYLSPIQALIAVSVLFGMVLAPVYGMVSPQSAIRRAKKSITAALYEAILFRRVLSVSLRAQGRMFIAGLRYAALAIPPILVLAIPSIVVLAYCNLYFGLAPAPAEVIVKGVLSESQYVSNVELSVPGALEVARVRNVKERTILWRIRPHESPFDGPYPQTSQPEMRLRTDAGEMTLPLRTFEAPGFYYPLLSKSFLDQVLYPTAFTRPEWLESLSIAYPERSYVIYGFSLSWIIIFLIISIASGFLVSRWCGVEL